MTERTVDFPAPLGPSSATVSPRRDVERDVDPTLGHGGVVLERHTLLLPCRAKPMTMTATTTRTSDRATAACASVSRRR